MTVTNNNTVNGCLPALVAAYFNLQQLAATVDITFTVADYGGLRDQETTEQLQAWEQQAVEQGEKPYRVAPWGESKHDVGGAVDVRIEYGGGWADPLAELGKFAPACGLIWGGTWSPDPDRPHFELEAPLETLREEWNQLHPAST